MIIVHCKQLNQKAFLLAAMEIFFVEIQLLVNKMFVPGREWSRRASADVTSVSDVHAMYY